MGKEQLKKIIIPETTEDTLEYHAFINTKYRLNKSFYFMVNQE